MREQSYRLGACEGVIKSAHRELTQVISALATGGRLPNGLLPRLCQIETMLRPSNVQALADELWAASPYAKRSGVLADLQNGREVAR